MLDSRMKQAAEKRRNVTARAFVTFPQMFSGALQVLPIGEGSLFAERKSGVKIYGLA
jgi:hypothetical protein